jgi:nucleoside-diphosphate kinase
MTTQRTLCIIKPDATARNLCGAILKMIEEAGFRIVGMKRLRLSREEAGAFYAVHTGKPFFDELCDFMCSGPVVVAALEGDDAITGYRTLMGATNPENADPGTIRKTYAQSLTCNSVHGSDSPENAAIEIGFFFSTQELVGQTG